MSDDALSQELARARRDAEDAERELEALMETVPYAISWRDRDGCYRGGNGKFAEFAECRREELVGRTDATLRWSEHADLYLADDRAVLSTGEDRIEYVEPVTGAAGSRQWMRTSKFALSLDGEVRGVISAHVRTADRASLSQQVVLARARYQTITRLLSEWIVICDASGVVGERNRAAKAETPPVRFLSELFRPGEEPRDEAPTRCVALVSGAEVDLSARVFPLTGAESLVMMRDLRGEIEAERRRLELEEQLAFSEDRDLGRFAGIVAHDFNNLLTVIISQCVISRRYLGPTDDALAEEIAKLEASARRGARLTRQLLTFSRKDTGDPKRVVVDDVLARLAPMLMTATSTTSRLHLTLDADEAQVRIDRTLFEQVIVNLVTNARDASDDARPVRIASAVAGDVVSVSVEDEGEGIPAALRVRVFEPLFTTRQDAARSGLGLAMVKGIVEQVGGQVTLTPRPGGGSIFTVQLPCSRAPTVDDEPVAGEASIHTVLLVEDDERVRALVRYTLQHLGYDVVAARDAGEALRQWEAHDGFDALVSDVMMPGTDGFALLDALRKKSPELPAVLMSGYAPYGNRDELRAAFLSKPFARAQLVAAIERAVRTARA